jgi:hypothetical protein
MTSTLEMQLFACGAYADYGDGNWGVPPAVEVRREAAPLRLRDLLPPASNVEAARRRLRDLLGDAPATSAPSITAVAICGRMPDPRAVQAIRQAVDEIPLRFRSRWIDAGGRLEIVPGENASVHPRFNGSPAVLGWNESRGPFCCVAGDHFDAPLTARHEVAHALDFVLGFPSRGYQWHEIWKADVAAGRVPRYASQRAKPAEYWAESFAKLFDPVAVIGSAAEEFILGLV